MCERTAGRVWGENVSNLSRSIFCLRRPGEGSETNACLLKNRISVRGGRWAYAKSQRSDLDSSATRNRLV
jgi:hypothetical protein